MRDKFRQIEKFVEIIESLIKTERELEARAKAAASAAAAGGAKQISLLDCGAGKGYLTFAAYEYLQRQVCS